MVDTTKENKARPKGSERDVASRATVPAMFDRATDIAPYRSQETGLTMREEFDRFVEHFLDRWHSHWPEVHSHWRWRVDIHDAGDSLVVRAEAPGFEPTDFDIQIRGYHLVICAMHKTESATETSGRRESQRHEFYRSILLPSEVERAKVEAEYRNGVLNVTLPKAHAGEKPQTIKVRGT